MISDAEARIWTRLGPRGAYGQALLKVAATRQEVIAISADLLGSSGLDRFSQEYPERCVSVGIAEQQMVGFAAGLAREGFVPFVSSFAPFIGIRAAEQIRMNLGYMHSNVKLVAIGSGVSMGFLGNSHYGLEDLAYVAAIPGMQIYEPSDPYDLIDVLYAETSRYGPAYIRLTGAPGLFAPLRDSYSSEPIESPMRLRSVGQNGGLSLAVVTAGSMASVCRAALDFLPTKIQERVEIHVIRQIKPLMADWLDDLTARFDEVLVVHEHSRFGGLAGVLSQELMFRGQAMRIRSMNLDDEYGPTGDYQYVLSKHNLTSEAVSCRIKEILGDFT